MRIHCKECSHSEEPTAEFFVKVIGGAMPIGGFWAWVTYFFAGTGFAFAICATMVVGGVALLAFKDEIVKLLTEKYPCPKCGGRNWDMSK